MGDPAFRRPTAFAARPIRLEVVVERELLCVLDVPRVLLRIHQAARGQGTVADQSTAKGQNVLLVGPAPSSLDCRAP